MAKAAKRGIWRGDVVAPWEWRKGKRLAGTQKSGHTAASRQGKRAVHRQGQHQQEWHAHLPRAGRPVLRPYAHRHLEGRAMVLHRGGGPGGRVAALAPVGHLPVPAPNRVDALNPHTPGTRLTTRGLATYNGRASERLWCRAPRRRVHRAPRESSWLLPDGQQGRPTKGRDSFRDRRGSRSYEKHSGHARTARSCAGGHVRGRVESRVRECYG